MAQLLAILVLVLISSALQEWAPSSADTAAHVTSTRPVRAIVWMSVLRANRSLATEVADAFASDSLGAPWPRWIDRARPSSCEPYRSSSYEPAEDVLWVHRCLFGSEDVTREAETFLLGADSVPTLERTRWSAGGASGLRGWDTSAFADSLVRALTDRLGALPDLRAREAAGGRYGKWLQIAAFAMPVGTLRLMRGNDPDSRDSLILEATSRRLEAALATASEHGSPYEEDEWGEVRQEREGEERASTARALRAIAPTLAAALDSLPSRPADAPAVARALAKAERAPDQASADLIRWGVHLWGSGISTEDSATAGRVNRAFGGRAERYLQVPDGWCWEDSLLEPLALRAGADRWADAAFLELLDRGWQATCALCGYDPRVGTDLFRPVIAHGDEFLRQHPGSRITREVRWRVAEAHETAWSLSKVLPDDEYIEAARYILDAPAHRTRAVELYEGLLRDEPPGPRRSAAIQRLRRMRLDVDTGFHDYWCLWD